jgi:hypothetical protein
MDGAARSARVCMRMCVCVCVCGLGLACSGSAALSALLNMLSTSRSARPSAADHSSYMLRQRYGMGKKGE